MFGFRDPRRANFSEMTAFAERIEGYRKSRYPEMSQTRMRVSVTIEMPRQGNMSRDLRRDDSGHEGVMGVSYFDLRMCF